MVFLAALSCISLQIGLPVQSLRLALVSILELHASVWLQQKAWGKGATRIDSDACIWHCLYTARLGPYRKTAAATTTAQ